MIADFGQRMENGRKVPSSINGEQIFNIFKDKPFGSILGRRAFEQSNDLKKERALFSCKPSLAAAARNVLTRESCRPEICSWKFFGFDFCNVFFIPFVLRYIKLTTIASVCKLIYFTVTFTFHTAKLKAFPKSAYAAEKVQKC